MNCNQPRLSYNVIMHRLDARHGIQYLMVQRRYTMAFLALLTGAIPMRSDRLRKAVITRLVAEMTVLERHWCNSRTFDELWILAELQFRSQIQVEHYATNAPFIKTAIAANGTHSNCQIEPEWVFPGGRRAHQSERDTVVAMRETMEESGYASHTYDLDAWPTSNTHVGSNGMRYKNIFFSARLKPRYAEASMPRIPDRVEIRRAMWLSLDHCLYRISGKNDYLHQILLKTHLSIVTRLPRPRIFPWSSCREADDTS